VDDADRCITVSISDPDANRAADNYEEVITLKVVPLNFKGKDISSLLPAEHTGTIHRTGTIEFQICMPACPYFEGGPYEIGVIAFDDACALPLSDTLRINVDVQPPHNEPAKFKPPDKVTATVNEGDNATWSFEADDAERDDLLFFALTDGFALSKAGMETFVDSNDNGVLKGHIHWDAFCDIYDFTKRTSFTLTLLVDDVDQCDINPPDTATFHLNVILPTDNAPIVDTDLTADPAEVEVSGFQKELNDSWVFNVTGKDLVDNDPVTVDIKGHGFDPKAYGMSFTKAIATGSVSSQFKWDLTCDNISHDFRDEFDIGFLAIDSANKCRVKHIDSLVVKVKVIKPINSPPRLSIVNVSNNATFANNTASLAPGELLQLQLNVTDDDVPKDNLSIEMINTGGDPSPQDYELSNATGVSILSSLFNWSPACDLIKGGELENDFTFDFRYSDDHCLTAIADTIRVNVKIRDMEDSDLIMEPSNVFTPNGDGFNDYYSMERRDASGTLINILPPDNCHGVFKTVRIYNRWGRTVFTSSDRNFHWDGLTEAAGVYFYHIIFTNREFKGTVSLRD
jgi:gliding motility-associated-like protein